MVISLQSQKDYFWLCFSLYIWTNERWAAKQILQTSFPFPILLFLLAFIFINFQLAENFCNSSFFLFSRCVSCIFTLVFMLSLDDCWWELFKSLEIFYCHEFMFNWCGISRVWSCLLVYMKELKGAEKQNT